MDFAFCALDTWLTAGSKGFLRDRTIRDEILRASGNEFWASYGLPKDKPEKWFSLHSENTGIAEYTVHIEQCLYS